MTADPKGSVTVREFAWLIEAPGQHYLGVRQLGGWELFWTKDHNKATRFHSREQADTVMMAVRELAPKLFAFAALLGEPRPVEHVWTDVPRAEAA